MPVFYSVSTPERGARLKRWLGTGGHEWCPIELPPFLPEAFDIRWGGTSASPVVMYDVSSGESLFVLKPPYGRFGRLMGRKLDRDSTLANVSAGPAAAHKVANAVFHLRALQCLARRCHECVKSASFAAIFEDDVEYVEGISPASAETFPRLLADAMRQVVSNYGVNKLQLAVGNEGQGVNIAWRKAKCTPHVANLSGWSASTGARLLECKQFSDSHAYVTTLAHARQITDTHAMLISQDGDGGGNCTNPWGHSTCGDDPAIFRDFFSQCGKPTEQSPRAECRGLVLASAEQPWSLRHNNADPYRMQSALGNDSYAAVIRMQSTVSVWEDMRARSDQIGRNTSEVRRRALEKQVLRRTSKELDRQEQLMEKIGKMDSSRLLQSLPMPVFYSVSTEQRGLRLRQWLKRGGARWCEMELPPVHPEDLLVEWDGRIGSPVFVQTAGDVVAGPSSTSAAPRFTDAEIRRWAMPPLEPRLTLFAIGAPYGNLHNQVEKGRRRPKSGLGAAHKVANAVFHLRALQCLAVRCHPCVQNASFATVLEDDVEFVDGVSPGSAEELPLLIADAMEQAVSSGANKLQLVTGSSGSGQEVDLPTRKARCSVWAPSVRDHADARLLQCTNFSDSHGYVITHAHARRIVEVHRHLIRSSGAGRCVNPWGYETCASDPAIFREFFKQCDKAAPNSVGRCSGRVLAGRTQPWTLLHNNSDGYRANVGEGQTDNFAAVSALVAALEQQALRTNSMRMPNASRGSSQTALKLNPNKQRRAQAKAARKSARHRPTSTTDETGPRDEY